MTTAPELRSGSPPAADAPLTVRDVLAMPCLHGAHLRAGKAGLDREITGVNIVEVPDVWRWLRGGELLFSAAYPWRDDPLRLAQLIVTLDQTGVAAIAFKLGQYVERLPEQMLAVADKAGFPVVQLPPELAYRDVIEPVYQRLTARRTALDRPSELKHKFTRFGLDDQSIEKVTGALSAQLRRCVYVVDLLDDVLFFGAPDGTAWRRPFDALSGEQREAVATLEGLRLGRNPTPVELPAGRGLATALIVGRESRGAMAVLDPDDAGAEWVEAELAHAAELVSFLQLKRLALLEGRRQAAGLFFDSLMADTLSNEEAAERAVTLGVHLTRPCMVVVVGSTGGRDRHEGREAVRVLLERALADVPHVVADGPDHDQLVALVEVGDADPDAVTQRVVTGLQAGLAGTGAGRLLVAAGTPRTGLEGVRRSRSEALIAYAAGERTAGVGQVRFDDLGVERLLSQIPVGPVAKDYVACMLDPIADDPELLRTLEVYLRNGGNKVATAAAIPMHRSSLMYRLTKISQLLGVDLNDPESCLELWLAIRLRRILALDRGSAGTHQ